MVGAPCGPVGLVVVGLHPDMAVHHRVVGWVEVGGAVDEPHQVALAGLPRVRPGATVVAVEHPVQRHRAAGRPRQLAEREEVDILVGAGDGEQQVTVRPLGVEPVVGEERHLLQGEGLAVGQAVAVVEQRRADRDDHRQVCRRRRVADGAGVERRVGGVPVLVRLAGHEPFGFGGQRAQRVAQLVPVVGGDRERRQQTLLVGRMGDAGLVQSPERQVPGAGRRSATGGRRTIVTAGRRIAAPRRHGRTKSRRGRPRQAAYQEVTARNVCHHRGRRVPTAVTPRAPARRQRSPGARTAPPASSASRSCARR